MILLIFFIKINGMKKKIVYRNISQQSTALTLLSSQDSGG